MQKSNLKKTALHLQHGIEETAVECRRLGATAHAFVVDCSKKEEIYSVSEKVFPTYHIYRQF